MFISDLSISYIFSKTVLNQWQCVQKQAKTSDSSPVSERLVGLGFEIALCLHRPKANAIYEHLGEDYYVHITSMQLLSIWEYVFVFNG